MGRPSCHRCLVTTGLSPRSVSSLELSQEAGALVQGQRVHVLSVSRRSTWRSSQQ